MTLPEHLVDPSSTLIVPVMSPPARAALQRLLAKGVVLARINETEYQLISANRSAISNILGAMGLGLTISEDYRMAALLRPQDTTEDKQVTDDNADPRVEDSEEDDDESGLTLVRTKRLSVFASVVLLELRKRFRDREQLDQIVTVDLDDLKDRLRTYWVQLNVTGARGDKHFSGAVSTMEKHCILLPIRGSKNIREISPVITLAMGPNQLSALVEEYTRLQQVHKSPETVDEQ